MSAGDSICFGLLAGGRSSRMGVDKASLDWRGQPLWQHQLDLATVIGAREVLISGRPDGPYCQAATVVPDEISDCGPLAGIAALLTKMQSEWLVAVAVDMPLVDDTTLYRLLAARSGQLGSVPLLNDHIEPLAAVYPGAARTLAQQCLRSTDRSLQGFVRAAAAAKLVQLLPWPAERSGCFQSVNTPAELAALRSA